jgi:probable rRNA maturation factor
MIKTICNFNIKSPYTTSWLQSIANRLSQKEKKIKGEVEITIVGDKEMTELNWLYRGKNYPTDVLSFAWQEDNKIKTKMLGQIYVCYPQIKRQAKDWGVKENEEMARMLIHGLLHLVGHDHHEKKQAKKMFKIQEGIIENLGYVTQKFD